MMMVIFGYEIEYFYIIVSLKSNFLHFFSALKLLVIMSDSNGYRLFK
jgi:hypothetical protein